MFDFKTFRPTEIKWLNPADLKDHPALAGLPQMAENGEDFKDFCDVVRDLGMLPDPVLVTSDHLVIDGRDRVRVARRMQVDVPVVVITEPIEAARIIEASISTTSHRKNYSKGQIALCYFPQLEAAYQEILGYPKFEKAPQTVAELAKRCRVSTDLFKQAADVWGLWKKHAGKKFKFDPKNLEERGLDPEKTYTLRDYYEPLIMDRDDPMGLGDALKGMGMNIAMAEKGHTGGKPKDKDKQLLLFQEAIGAVGRRTQYWNDWDNETRKAALEPWKTALPEMPDTLIEQLKKTLAAELRRRKKGGK